MSSRTKKILNLAVTKTFQESSVTEKITATVNEPNCQTVLIPDDDLLMVLGNALGNSSSISNCDFPNCVIYGEVHDCKVLSEDTSAFDEDIFLEPIIVNENENNTADALLKQAQSSSLI